MKLELHQLDRRYGGLRSRAPVREKCLLASQGEHGQQMLIVVVADEGEFRVALDGHKLTRRFHRQPAAWSPHRLRRSSTRETPLKQWLPQIDPPQIRSHERDPRRAGSREPLYHPRLEPEQLLEPAEADGVRIRKAGPSACPWIAHLESCERTMAPRRRMTKER